MAYTWHLTVSSYRARSRLPARYFSPPSTFFDYITLLVLFLSVDETRYRIIRVVFINAKRRNKRDRQLSRRVRRIFKNLLEEEVEKGK